MKVTLRLTKDNGEIIEITKTLGTLSSSDVIFGIETELGKLKVEVFPIISEALLKEQQDLFSADKEQNNIQKNGSDEVTIYTLQGSYNFENQKYTLKDGSSSNYLSLCGSFDYGHYSRSLCDTLEEWSDDLSYEKTSEMLLQRTDTEVFSSTSIGHYLQQKAASISQKWHLEAHTAISQIEVDTNILLHDSEAKEVILMMDDVGVKAQKPHKEKRP